MTELQATPYTKISDKKTYITNNYDVFKKLGGNRLINQKNVDTIIKNIEVNGVLPTIVIVNEKMEIIDGQHRVEAFKRLGINVMFQIFEGLDLDDCIAMNISGKKWSLIDYVHSYAEQGSEDYIYLHEKILEYPMIPAQAIASMLSVMLTGNGGGISLRNIKNGEFKLTDDYKKRAKAIEYASKFPPEKVTGAKSAFFVTIGKLFYANFEEINYKKMLERYKKNQKEVVSIVNETDVLNILQRCYNWKSPNSVRFVDKYFDFYDSFYKDKRSKSTIKRWERERKGENDRR